jgi:hypothetical protein
VIAPGDVRRPRRKETDGGLRPAYVPSLKELGAICKVGIGQSCSLDHVVQFALQSALWLLLNIRSRSDSAATDSTRWRI